MKIALSLLILLSQASCSAPLEHQAFLSWYDGFGTHTVWGVGAVTGGYGTSQVKCGGVNIQVVPIHDTHENDGSPLLTNETVEYAKKENARLLGTLVSRGYKCKFDPIEPLHMTEVPEA